MRIDPETIALMQAEIDGATSAQESQELRTILTKDPLARDHFDQLKKIAGMLDDLDEVAPPADLKTKVLTAVGRPSEPVTVHPATFRAGTARRYVYAAAAGVLLGVLGYHWATDGLVVDPTDVMGSIATHDASTEPPDIQEFPLNFEGVIGTARLQSVNAGFSLEIDLSSEVPVGVVFGFSPEEVQIRGFFSDLGEIHSLEVASSEVHWVQSGHDRVSVSLDTRGPARTSVEIAFSIEGTVVHSLKVGLPGSGT